MLFTAGRITSINLSLKGALSASGVAALVGLVPFVGWLLSPIALFVLIKKDSGADIWPDTVLLVVVGWAVALAATFVVGDGLD